MHRILLVVAALAIVACGGSKKPEEEFPVPEGPPDAGATATTEEGLPPSLVARVERAVAFIEQLVVAAESAAGDCAKMGTDLQALVDGPDGKVILEMDLDAEYQEHAKQVATEYGPRLDQLAIRIGEAIAPCDTEAVNTALTQAGLQ